MKTVAYPHPVAPGQAGFAGQTHTVPVRVFYRCPSRLYASRARAGLSILSKKRKFLYYCISTGRFIALESSCHISVLNPLTLPFSMYSTGGKLESPTAIRGFLSDAYPDKDNRDNGTRAKRRIKNVLNFIFLCLFIGYGLHYLLGYFEQAPRMYPCIKLHFIQIQNYFVKIVSNLTHLSLACHYT